MGNQGSMSREEYREFQERNYTSVERAIEDKKLSTYFNPCLSDSDRTNGLRRLDGLSSEVQSMPIGSSMIDDAIRRRDF